MRETWKNIPGTDGVYQISTFGRIKRKAHKITRGNGTVQSYKERVWKGYLNKDGYYRVKISYMGKQIYFGEVHQLMAMIFLGHKINRHTLVVDHIDNDRKNNKLSNLQITSVRHNSSKDKTGLTGACWIKKRNKWQSDINIGGIKYYLGYYDLEEDANAEYIKVLETYRRTGKVIRSIDERRSLMPPKKNKIIEK